MKQFIADMIIFLVICWLFVGGIMAAVLGIGALVTNAYEGVALITAGLVLMFTCLRILNKVYSLVLQCILE